MSQFAIIRVGKLKGWSKVRAASGHNFRTRPTPNANPSAEAPRLLHGEKDLGDAVANAIAGLAKKPRKDAVLCSEVILTGSPEKLRSMTKSELDEWASVNVAWLKAKHGKNLLQAVLHLDESTPHIHAMICPINKGGNLSAKSYWGEAAGLRKLQSDYGALMKPFGLERGVAGSKADHTEVRDFYKALANTKKATPPPPMPPRPRTEEKSTLGLVKAGTVAEAERSWRGKLTGWRKKVVAAEETARFAASGLMVENSALKRAQVRSGGMIEKMRKALEGWRLVKKHFPGELKELLTKAKLAELAPVPEPQKSTLRVDSWEGLPPSPTPPALDGGEGCGATGPTETPATPEGATQGRSTPRPR